MEALIEFCQLMDSITNEEFNGILGIIAQYIIKGSNKEKFRRVIFDYFTNELELEIVNDHRLSITDITQIIYHILKQRVFTESEKESNINQTFDFPNTILQKISSFLELKSYSKFERCNRNIFIATRKPSLLPELILWRRLRLPEQNIYFNMNRFKKIQKLRFDDYDFEYIEQIKWNDVTDLQIQFHSNIDYVFPDILNQFDSLFNVNNIRHLRLDFMDYSDAGNAIVPQSIYSFICKCKQLCLLTIHFPDAQIETNIMNQLLQSSAVQNLKGICCANGNNLAPVFVLIQKTLQALHINDGLEYYPCLFHNNIFFTNLRELKLPETSVDYMLSLVQKCKKLERVHFDLDITDNCNCLDLMKTVLNLKFLQFFGVWIQCRKDMIQFIEILEQLLPTLKRQMPIKLDVTLRGADEYRKDTHLLLVRLMNTLNTWISNDFMLIYNQRTCSDETTSIKNIKTCMKDWVPFFSSKFMTKFVSTKNNLCYTQTLIIANKMNKFNGYKEEWIIQ